MASDRHFDTVSAIADDVRSGTRSAVSVVQRALDRVASTDAQLNAFVHLDADRALAAARSLDRRIADGEPVGPLAGVPFGVKDAVDCIGMPTRQGSVLYIDAPAAQSDSPHVARIRAADAIPIGKTTTSEFGLDSATNTRAHGVTRNPWNLRRTPGGSSGGSAAAVAAGVVPFATAADGGGSTRGPAANCGLVGLKPTHGLIGTSASPDFGVHGFLTYDVLGSARLLDVTAGPTTRDRTSLSPRPDVSFEQSTLTDDVAGLRVAWTTDMGHAVVDPEIAGIAEQAACRLTRAARLVMTTYTVETISAFDSWMHSSVALLRGSLELDGHWPSRRDDLSPILQHMLAKYGESSFVDLALASRQRAEIETAIDEAFADVDVILSPTSACAPWAADGPYPSEIAGRDASTTGPDTMMMIANMCWLPAISVPAGQTSDGLPVGLQMMTRRGDDAILLRLARLLEEDAPWAQCPLDWQAH